MREDRRKEVLEIWKTIISVQQHFNDIEMRIRGLFVTIILGVFASIGFLFDKQLAIGIYNLKIEFYILMPIFGIFVAWLFYFVDRHWYHRLLLGSVLHGIEIEKKFAKEIPELSLSKAIGDRSPYKPSCLVRILAKIVVKEPRFHETGLIHSDGKIELFYKSVMVFLFAIFIVLALLGGIQITPPKWLPLYMNL